MTDNTQKQETDKAKVINLADERKRIQDKAKDQDRQGDTGPSFNLSDLKIGDVKPGGYSIGQIFQLLVFMLVMFFFLRECQGG